MVNGDARPVPGGPGRSFTESLPSPACTRYRSATRLHSGGVGSGKGWAGHGKQGVRARLCGCVVQAGTSQSCLGLRCGLADGRGPGWDVGVVVDEVGDDDRSRRHVSVRAMTGRCGQTRHLVRLPDTRPVCHQAPVVLVPAVSAGCTFTAVSGGEAARWTVCLTVCVPRGGRARRSRFGWR